MVMNLVAHQLEYHLKGDIKSELNLNYRKYNSYDYNTIKDKLKNTFHITAPIIKSIISQHN